jgi:hypothetical protein
MKLKLIQSIHPDEGLKIKRKSQIGIKWRKLLILNIKTIHFLRMSHIAVESPLVL